MQADDVDVEVAVNEDVAESGDLFEPAGKFGGEDSDLHETLDAGRIIGDIAAGSHREMSGDVESVLRAELQPTLDSPSFFVIRPEQLDRLSLVCAQRLESLIKRKQMAPDDHLIEAHRPKSPASIRAAWTESILRKCGR